MTNRIPFYLALFLLAFSLSSCDLIYGIFEAGMWVGLIVVALFVGIILWVINKFRGKR
jgi:protein-S-isoprenylcysteine O-methyltransferase Ste14